jgi:hypothetical protein
VRNKIMYLLRNDAACQKRAQADPVKAIREFPLTPAERKALTAGDVRALYEMGAHAYLLQQLSSAKLFGVNGENYLRRIRGQERPG